MKKRNYSQAGFTLTELLVTIGIIGIIAGLILTAIARAKHKANRITCLNNLSQIGKALIGFGHDHEDRMPWQLEEGGRKLHFGEHYDENSSAIFGIYALKLEIQNARTLHSPCDSGRATYSEEAQSHWAEYDTKEGKFISPEAITYDLVKGGDIMRPTTILGLTRNLYSRELHKSRWVGADEEKILSAERHDPVLPEGIQVATKDWVDYIKDYPDAGLQARRLLHKYGRETFLPQVINGLNRGQGQVLMADGSAALSSDADLGRDGKLVKPHILAHSVGTFPHPYLSGLNPRHHVFSPGGSTAKKAVATAMRGKDLVVREWRYDGFLVAGDEEFYTYVVDEIELLKQETPGMYKVAKKHVGSFNCNGTGGTCATWFRGNGDGGVHIAREIFNHGDPGWHTLIFIHEIQHCDVESCTTQGAANFSMVVYGKQIWRTEANGLINWCKHLARSEGYTQDMWDYHHSEEFAKKRIPYKEFTNKNGGGFNVSK
tara:strand:+ start:160 stop:1623 length:1464 start_codon:yes stop_codon:yes gene_type:complete